MKHTAFAAETSAKFRAAAKQHAVFLVEMTQELSSGNISTEELIAMGHPYARRFAVDSAPTPDYVINAQTGTFKEAWKSTADLTAGNWVILVWNDSAYAKFMMGTDRMRKRGILDEIDKRSALHLQQLLTAVLLENAREYTSQSASSPFGGGGALIFAIYAGTSALAGAVRTAV